MALRLAFELPKGSYATILVKRITEAAGSAEAAEAAEAAESAELAE